MPEELKRGGLTYSEYSDQFVKMFMVINALQSINLDAIAKGQEEFRNEMESSGQEVEVREALMEEATTAAIVLRDVGRRIAEQAEIEQKREKLGLQ
jgi:hypothetical protein